MSKIFQFGEKVEGYDTLMINEREARASAGIIFLVLSVSFSFVAFKSDFFLTEMFAFTFFLEFFIRIFINPKYAPYIIIGRMFVKNQKPEYVGAPQKRFAWIIGFLLGLTTILMIIYNNTGDERVMVCLLCLVFLFAEAVFGICIGCKLYSFLTRKQAQNCQGGVCEMKGPKEEVQKISFAQIAIVIAFIAAVYYSQPLVEDRVYAYELSFEDMEAMEEFGNTYEDEDEDDEDEDEEDVD